MTSVRKISVSMPEDLAEKLEGKGNRSAFVAAAIEEKLARDHNAAVLARMFGADYTNAAADDPEGAQWAEGVLNRVRARREQPRER
ncbi:CopG family ribbon-helix-helix protein [Nonomuraea sp. NPDC059194]|uniref:CopG family ribbon-helix-helix protein n=1 Tax=Nonomuraea sp. NPDC059194 TaxID=3346764 RepID=UPI00369D9E6D